MNPLVFPLPSQDPRYPLPLLTRVLEVGHHLREFIIRGREEAVKVFECHHISKWLYIGP